MTHYRIAQTVWARSGADRANSCQVDVPAPLRPRIRAVVETVPAESGLLVPGVAVAPDGSLRVTLEGGLHRVTLAGRIEWSRPLLNLDGQPCKFHSAPLALASGATAVALGGSVLVIEAGGDIVRETPVPFSLDDRGESPNTTDLDTLVISGVSGQLALTANGNVHALQTSGLDVAVPAVYADGSLGVAFTFGRGYGRLRLDGTFLWPQAFEDAEGPACIGPSQYAALPARPRSVVVTPDGKLAGEYSERALFAAFGREEWIALSPESIARLDLRGQVRWRRPFPPDYAGYGGPPVVDSAGRIYFATGDGVVALDPNGEVVWTIRVGRAPVSLAVVAPGLLAAALWHQVVLLEEGPTPGAAGPTGPGQGDGARLERLALQLLAMRAGRVDIYWPWLQRPDGHPVVRLTMQAANKFLLGCIINQARRAEQSWAAAKRLAEEEFGDPARLWDVVAAFTAEAWAAEYDRLRQVIGMRARHHRVWRIGVRLVAEYGGDARRLWNGQEPGTVQQRLDDLALGTKITRMTVGALIDTGHLDGTGDLAPDTHVRRVLGRLVTGQTAEAEQAIALGRLVYPANAWLLDAPLYFHGIEVCRTKRPKCEECRLRRDCTHAAQRPPELSKAPPKREPRRRASRVR